MPEEMLPPHTNERPTKPNLDDFEAVLQTLAKHTKELKGSPYTAEWVRGSITAAGTKLRALRFLLNRRHADGPMALLDVGAQIGSMAIYAARLGLRVAAVDYPYFVEPYGTIAKQHGVDYLTCDVAQEPLPFPDHAFDCVTYLDVIEHHAFSPKRVLLEIHRVLKPGGCLIITTPNHASIYNRFALVLGQSVNDPFSDFFEGAAHVSLYPGHHREYTRRELRTALQKTGFNVLQCMAIEENLSAEWRHPAIASEGNKLRSAWHQKKFLAALLLAKIWMPLRLPFSRVLWAVGEKLG